MILLVSALILCLFQIKTEINIVFFKNKGDMAGFFIFMVLG